MPEARRGAHVPGVVRNLVRAHDLEPWVPQAAFSSLLVLDVLLRWLGGNPVAMFSWPALAVVVAVVASLVSVLVPWRRLPVGLLCLLPVVDLGVVGLARLDVQVGGAGVLAVIPALWLGGVLGRRGALVALVSCVVLMVVPGFLYLGTSMPVVSRSLLIPVVAVSSALAIAAALEKARVSLEEARERQVQLAAALATIEDQRRFSEAILDTVDVGLVLLDADGAYRAMNRRHRVFMGLAYPDGHAGRAGQPGHVYGPDGATPLTRQEMPTLRASRGEEFDDHLVWLGQDPLTNRAVSVSARAVRDDDGSFTGAALAYKDVTDFMRALRVKDEFVASVSHELRTPLTSIVGYVLLLGEREDLATDVVKQLGVVARNADRLQRLVADLLQTAQVDEGPLQVVRTRTDLAQIVRDAVVAATPTAAAAGIHLEVDAPARLELPVDAQRMAQVVDNLLSNAIKYSPGGGEVCVRLHLDGNRAELAVSDTGIGIEAADRDRLFTRFFRARHAEERSIQGVGLGLSITKSIVESHGGRIVVDSEIGRGSTFRIRLPLE
jgi:two-component system phosphate regulon sensor histidine kinase PhoR